MKNVALQILVWIAVVTWSLWFGGLMYEVVVITPLWSSSLPQSVLEWNSRPQYVVIPTKFFAPVAVATVLSSLMCVILGWKGGGRRLWSVVSFVCAAVTLGFTLIYFFPKNAVLFLQQTGNLSGEELTAIATAWLTGNWIRIVIMAVGFFAALKALSLPRSD